VDLLLDGPSDFIEFYHLYAIACLERAALPLNHDNQSVIVTYPLYSHSHAGNPCTGTRRNVESYSVHIAQSSCFISGVLDFQRSSLTCLPGRVGRRDRTASWLSASFRASPTSWYGGAFIAAGVVSGASVASTYAGGATDARNRWTSVSSSCTYAVNPAITEREVLSEPRCARTKGWIQLSVDVHLGNDRCFRAAPSVKKTGTSVSSSTAPEESEQSQNCGGTAYGATDYSAHRSCGLYKLTRRERCRDSVWSDETGDNGLLLVLLTVIVSACTWEVHEAHCAYTHVYTAESNRASAAG
jgi:hypothetical protein